MRIMTANLNGIRSAQRKGFFDWLEDQRPDVLCIQETKAQRAQLEDGPYFPEGYHAEFVDAERKGYSGVAVYSRRQPDDFIRGLGMAEIDREGRWLEARFGALSVVSFYMPSGSSGEHRQGVKNAFMEPLMERLTAMAADGREYIICGDWNIAHTWRDLKNWRSNQKNSGFLPHEREWMDRLFGEAGFVDVFRRLNDASDQYTWWSFRGQARANNTGWRIDYQVATPGVAGTAVAEQIHREPRFSDHAPLCIDYDWSLDLSADPPAASGNR
ncbi:exodeoxyribonuclease III [Spiribacter sp. 2438]|uniref:exodeoxyribonuclease III n=1 Tax=Spiribacter sp. 2438 TaxID=2666185 RepID=UPI0012B14898|nr:exodeoxyribonuclease III [Spiribacter sp. 2438]QGM22477.1 exodeoxyribonuclease III [Spiribacter sp. 2438]